jgi:hypothetical protein
MSTGFDARLDRVARIKMRTPAPQRPAFAVPETRTWRASGSVPWCVLSNAPVGGWSGG